MTTAKEIEAGHKLPVSEGGSLPDKPATEPPEPEPVAEAEAETKPEPEPET